MANAQSSTKAKERRKRPLLLALLLLAAALVAGALLIPLEQLSKSERGGVDLCPANAGSATLLLDLRKPLHKAAPSALLRQLSRDLSIGTELQVFTLSGDARAPRRFVQRLCKPYDNADLTIQTAKDQRQGVRDCDDPPAQLPRQLRDAVAAFCSQREALAVRIDHLSKEAPQASPVVNAYLIEALEETKRTFADRPKPWSLYLFSDMLQHAAWYSHLDLDWTQWRFADFEPLRNARQPPLPLLAAAADLRVKVFYLPRQGLTEPARQRRAHQGFWRTYFSGAGLVFEDASPLPAYSALPLMRGLAEDASPQELELLERQREETEVLLARMAQERAALDEQRREDVANEQQRTAREAELRRLEQAVAAARQRQQELDASEAVAAERVDAPSPPTSPPAESTEEVVAAEPAPPAETEEAVAAEPDPSAETEEAVAAGPDPSAELALATAQPVDGPTAPSRPDAVALAPADPAAPGPCAATLKPQFLTLLETDSYPGNQRVHYGAGVIAVRYTLSDDGLTLDEEVVLQRDQSSAARPAFLDALAEDTVASVRAWEFEFENADSSSCSKRQQQTATFTYRSQCVGTPVPSCRTVQSDVAIRSAP